MAISLKTSGSWAETTTDPTTATLVGSPAAGDRYFLWVAWKAYDTTCAITSPQAWTEVTEYTDGAVAAGSNVGSVKVACYYRDWVSGDGNPSIDWSAGPVPAVYVMQLWQKAAEDTWDTPLFATAPHAASAGPVTRSATSGTTVVPDGSVVFALWGIRDDSSTITRSTTAIDVASGIVWNGNYVESPATHIYTTTSNDISADLGHRFVTTGGTVTLRSSVDALSASETAAILWVVQPLEPPPWNGPVWESMGTPYVNASTSAPAVAAPSGVAADDIVLISLGSTSTVTSAPSGFAQTGDSPLTSGSVYAYTYWKRASGGGEPATYDFTLSGAGYTEAVAIRVSGCITSGDPFDVTDGGTGTGTSSFPDVSDTTTVDETLLLWCGFNQDGGAGAPLTTFPAGFGSRLNTTGVHSVADKTQAAAGDTGTLSATAASGTGAKTAWLGAFKPPSAGLPPVNEDDPVGATDALTKTQGWVRTPGDPVGATDALAKGVGRSYTDPVGVTDSISVTLGRSYADPVGVTDTLTKGVGRAPADSVGVTDNAAPAQDFARTASDDVGVSDSITVGLALTSESVDGIGVEDALTRVADAARVADDPVGVTDSLSTAADTDRVSADTVGIVDSVGVQQDWVRAAADEFEVGDSLTAVISLTSTAGDDIGVTDDLDTAADYARTATDSIDAADNIAVGAGRSPVDPAGIADALSTVADYQRSLDDPIGITDYTVFELAGSGEVVKTDLIGVTDTLTRVADSQRAADDPVGVTDTIGVGQGRTVTNPVGATDTVVTAQGRAADDELGITDSAALAQGRTAADQIGVTDAAAVGQDRIADDLVGVTDDLGLISDTLKAVADSVAITDAVVADLSGAGESNHTNPVGITDAVARVADAQRTADDELGVTDSVSADITLAVSAADVVELADTLSLVSDTEKTFDDTAAIDDAIGLTTGYERSWTDPVGVADEATFVLGHTTTSTDSVDISDELALITAAERAWTDPVGVTDSATFDLSAARPEDQIGLTDLVVIDMWGPADPDRIHPVQAQSRIFGVRPESRTYAARPEPRIASP